MRKEILLNNGWYFHKGDIELPRPSDKGPVYSQSKTVRYQVGPAAYSYMDMPDAYNSQSGLLTHEWWERVDLPHDYIIDQDITDRSNTNTNGYMKYENAWYRKHFKLSDADKGKRIVLRFDGIATESAVYFNGCVMHHNYSAYNTFEVDITDYAYFDRDNVIAVYVNTDHFEGWWYQGGGIYRNVYLTITDKVAIDLWGVYAPSEKLDGNTWRVNFETTVVNADYSDADIKLKSEIIDSKGNVVATAEGKGVASLREKTTVKYTATVNSPKLWDCDTPNLYSVKTTLYKDGEAIDESYTRIGFRTVEITVDKGLLLNGKKTIIKGLCGHQDYGLTGIAVPDNVARYKVRLMKEMGANGYRTSHYQQTEAYMDAFDEMGFLVMDEVRWFESTKESYAQIESLLKRDRNRPSVIFWSTSNEEPLHITDVGANIHRAMAAEIRKLDNTRYITAAVCHSPDKCRIYDDCDVVGINYTLEIYDKVHEQKPDKPIFSSECCATGTTRGWCFDHATFRLSEWDRNAYGYEDYFLGRERTWQFLMSRPYVFGAYQWTSVDHRGECVWPALSSRSGALDMFLQKKGAFYQNKSFWTDEPMVYIVPHWNFEGLEGEEINVTVYTNCDELELFLNGETLGRKQIEKYGHGEWLVSYAAGTLKACAYRNGELVCTDERVTTGKPVALKLTLDNDFTANGRDLALFTCECVDSEGRVVPDAEEFVHFTATSPARIVGTGSDNCDHANVTNTDRQMYMGKISVAVKPSAGQKEISLLARSANCKAAKLTVQCGGSANKQGNADGVAIPGYIQ